VKGDEDFGGLAAFIGVIIAGLLIYFAQSFKGRRE
jgi:hypothetical protein